jgi:hypothetical protein
MSYGVFCFLRPKLPRLIFKQVRKKYEKAGYSTVGNVKELRHAADFARTGGLPGYCQQRAQRYARTT